MRRGREPRGPWWTSALLVPVPVLVLVTAMGAVAGDARAQDVGEDRPPTGTRSLFDHLFSREADDGSAQYDIPSSFEGVLERMRQIQGGEPLAVPIPMGRSVQRLETDLKDPRNVAAFSSNARVNYRGRLLPALKDRLYVGYGRFSDQLEVISYNQDAARFEFQLVKNLSKPGEQRVLYAPREFCSSCHTQQVPFFPREPWEETTAFPATATASGKAMGLPPEVDLTNEKYLGVQIGFVNNAVAYAIDRSVDTAATQVTFQRFWREGCQVADNDAGVDAVGCRARLLKLAMRRSLGFTIDTASANYTELTSTFLPRLETLYGPLVHFPISDLPTRNPLTADGGFVASTDGDAATLPLDSNDQTIDRLRSKTTIPRQFDPLNANPSTDDPYMYHPLHGGDLEARSPSGFQYVSYDADEDQPRIRRSRDPALLSETVVWIVSILALDREYYKALRTTGVEAYARLDGAIDAMAETARTTRAGVLAGEPLTADKVLAGIGRQAREESFNFLVTADRRLPPIVTETGGGPDPDEELEASETLALAHFRSYCSTCHGAGAAIEIFPGDLSRMVGDYPAKVLRRIDWERCVPENSRNRMPPVASTNRRRLCDAPDARAAMIAFLRQRFFPDAASPCGEGFTLGTPLTTEAATAAQCPTRPTPGGQQP